MTLTGTPVGPNVRVCTPAVYTARPQAGEKGPDARRRPRAARKAYLNLSPRLAFEDQEVMKTIRG